MLRFFCFVGLPLLLLPLSGLKASIDESLSYEYEVEVDSENEKNSSAEDEEKAEEWLTPQGLTTDEMIQKVPKKKGKNIKKKAKPLLRAHTVPLQKNAPKIPPFTLQKIHPEDLEKITTAIEGHLPKHARVILMLLTQKKNKIIEKNEGNALPQFQTQKNSYILYAMATTGGFSPLTQKSLQEAHITPLKTSPSPHYGDLIVQGIHNHCNKYAIKGSKFPRPICIYISMKGCVNRTFCLVCANILQGVGYALRKNRYNILLSTHLKGCEGKPLPYSKGGYEAITFWLGKPMMELMKIMGGSLCQLFEANAKKKEAAKPGKKQNTQAVEFDEQTLQGIEIVGLRHDVDDMEKELDENKKQLNELAKEVKKLKLADPPEVKSPPSTSRSFKFFSVKM